jgi:hypothetical protein
MATKKAVTDVAQKLNITARKGDTFRLSVTFKNSDGTGGISIVDNYNFKMDIRDSAFDDSVSGAIISISTTQESPISNGFDTSGGSGNVIINISSSTMNGIDGGRYVYDLQATNTADSSVQTWLKGNFVVNEDVTVN